MTCYHPIKAYRTPDGVVFAELGRHDIVGRIDLPCGQCIGCRMRRASDWELRVMHEASLHADNCFVTLTYGRDLCPPDMGLQHRDYQLFMKRVRKRFAMRVRYYMCGEYGPVNLRPHYHACLFGVGFREDRTPAGKSGSGSVFYHSAELEALWGYGRVSVQDLTRETAGYCARYIMKKALGEAANAAYVREGGVLVKPEYAAMSLKPGIGAGWFDRFHRDVLPRDYVVSAGVRRRVPRYYDVLGRRMDGQMMEDVAYERELSGRAAYLEQTEERLKVREVVHEARVRTLQRNLE